MGIERRSTSLRTAGSQAWRSCSKSSEGGSTAGSGSVTASTGAAGAVAAAFAGGGSGELGAWAG